MAEEDPSDAATFLSDPGQRTMFEANFTAGMVQNEEGLYEMTMALWNWGFALEDVRQPFHVFYGDADDIISSEMPARRPAAACRHAPHLARRRTLWVHRSRGGSSFGHLLGDNCDASRTSQDEPTVHDCHGPRGHALLGSPG